MKSTFSISLRIEISTLFYYSNVREGWRSCLFEEWMWVMGKNPAVYLFIYKWKIIKHSYDMLKEFCLLRGHVDVNIR